MNDRATGELARVDALSPKPDRRQSGEIVLRHGGRACLSDLMNNAAAARAGDPEGIHQMRVAVRRLRAILSGFAPFLPPEPRRTASSELRWFVDILGQARNFDVFATDILAPARDALAPSRELESLERRLDQHRQLALALTRWFDGCKWRSGVDGDALSRPIGQLGPAVLDRRFRQFKKRSRHFARQPTKERHQLRIALKKLRYSAELHADFYDRAAAKRFINRAKRLQDDLGYINDIRVARDIIKTLANSGTADISIAETGRHMIILCKHRLARDEARLRRRLLQLRKTAPFWSSAA